MSRDLSELVPEGTILDGRFEIRQFLGAGSFGEVYQARQVIFGQFFRNIALKLFKKDSINKDNVADILNDAIALIRLMEDNPPPDVEKRLVKVHDIGIVSDPDTRAFMSMQLVTGRKTLNTEVRRHRESGMPVELSLWYITRVLIPLAWMHEHEVVHGDLKPDNVLLREDSDVVLTDFGLAARLPIGVTGGAIMHQAPEVLSGQIGETQADVYSLGLMWYELLTGRNPFENVGLEEQGKGDQKGYIRAQLAARKWPVRKAQTGLLSEQEQRIQPASEINEELLEFPQVEAILNRCLAYRISDRFSNAGMILQAIESLQKTGKIQDWITEKPDDENGSTHGGQTGKDPEALVADAMVVHAQGQHDRSLKRLDTILENNGNYIPALLAKARIHAALKQTNEAMKLVEKVVKLTPKGKPNPEAYEALAFIYQASGQQSMASQMQKIAANLRSRK